MNKRNLCLSGEETNMRKWGRAVLRPVWRILNAAVNRLERGRRVVPLSGPTEAIVHVSDACTLDCVMCMNAQDGVEWPREGVHVDSGVFDLPALVELLDTWPTLRSICFAGVGEPLLAPDMEAMVKFAHAQGLVTEIVTNGTELERHADWMTDGSLDTVSISLNAWDKPSMERYCGVPQSTFDSVRQGIRSLVEVADSKSTDLGIEISSVMWRSRLDEAANIVAFAEALGVPRVTFHNLIPSSKPGCGSDEVLTPADAPKVRQLSEKFAGSDIDVRVPCLFDASTQRSNCPSPWRVLYVDASGGVSGCFRVEAPALDNGDWRDVRCWTGHYYSELRRSHCDSSADSLLPDRCEHCVEVHGVRIG